MSESKKSRSSAVSQTVQALALGGTIWIFRCLGPVSASNLGGWLARAVGPRLRVSRIADANLQRALPRLDAVERARIIKAVWDNLGRTSTELPHLASFARTSAGPGWEIEGEEHIKTIKSAGTQALFFSGHFGNWEMILPIAAQLGLNVSGFYRAASNARIDSIIQRMRNRALNSDVLMFAKGARGARLAIRYLQQGGSLGLLVDQKMNDGVAVPFFGRDAMTAPALAQFAIRFNASIVPIRVIRLGPARFRLVCEPPLVVAHTADQVSDVHAICRAMNATLERWIRAEPASWLWLHRRWPKDETSGAPEHMLTTLETAWRVPLSEPAGSIAPA